ncbi:glycoside hydrolase family 13 protein [Aeromicrobium sp. CF4.19]|uniref:glycoside hydrolase family 13 protein n=1 Tax=Aeromicrobium sp. CF4.19 TaxID=3373082 RepID=UPI003EE66F2B
MPTQPWWRDAVIYQVYPRSWADDDGDGVGDLPGITSRLEHLVDLGVDALWLSPFYVSPQQDGGYDVADFTGVDPLFGTLADFDALVARAHDLRLRVIVDIVPNHTSSEHPWFRQALASPPGSAERARYVFREGRGPDGSEPPNNWVSNFGGRAWTRVDSLPGSWEAQQSEDRATSPALWYLHLFDVTQPDLDWTNPVVQDELEDVLRFWLDRGVDGFRIDVAHGLAKADGLPDADLTLDPNVDDTSLLPMWDQPAVHDIYRRWRRLVDSYASSSGGPTPSEVWAADDDRLLCAEAWVQPPEALARYVRPDELHQSFNFSFLKAPWLAEDLRTRITETLRSAETVGAPQTWVLSNHDVVRHATRLGYEQRPGTQRIAGIGAADPQPDAALGLRRARALTALMLALPGSAYLYQGEELGLPEATTLPDDARQDPTWVRSGHTSRGRDGCRVPVPWSADGPSLGFGPGEGWLPQPSSFEGFSPDQQRGVEGSTLELYRSLLGLRRDLRLGRGSLTWAEEHPESAVVFTSTTPDGVRVLVVANPGPDPVRLPEGAQVLVATGTLVDTSVPTDVTVWARLPWPRVAP